ncbi:MAG: phosphatase PAP2 family protein [Clostridia bacterium]|nr:phosphatase PAP2 family protein [Clostridia bacterium]
MYQSFIKAELAILDFFDFMRFPFMNKIMTFISALADDGILWIVVGIVMLFFKNTRKGGVCVLLALIINLVIVNVTLKPLVARTRPYDINTAVNLIVHAPHDYSFPSGHTSASFAAALSIFFANKKWGTCALVGASLIGFSRLYLYVHFPTDVLFGALFGIAASFVSKYVISKIKMLG